LQEAFDKYKGLDSSGVDNILQTCDPILGLLITHNKIKAILSKFPAEIEEQQSKQEIEEMINKLINQYDERGMLEYIQSQFTGLGGKGKKKDEEADGFFLKKDEITEFCQEHKISPQIITYLTEKVAELICHENCREIDPKYNGESHYFAGKLLKNYKTTQVEDAGAEQVEGKGCCVLS